MTTTQERAANVAAFEASAAQDSSGASAAVAGAVIKDLMRLQVQVDAVTRLAEAHEKVAEARQDQHGHTPVSRAHAGFARELRRALNPKETP